MKRIISLVLLTATALLAQAQHTYVIEFWTEPSDPKGLRRVHMQIAGTDRMDALLQSGIGFRQHGLTVYTLAEWRIACPLLESSKSLSKAACEQAQVNMLYYVIGKGAVHKSEPQSSGKSK